VVEIVIHPECRRSESSTGGAGGATAFRGGLHGVGVSVTKLDCGEALEVTVDSAKAMGRDPGVLGWRRVRPLALRRAPTPTAAGHQRARLAGTEVVFESPSCRAKTDENLAQQAV